MAAERLKKIKEEPLVDERLPHPYREVVAELRAIKAQLEEISRKLPIAIPLAPPVVVKPPLVPAIALPKEEFRKIYEEALERFEALRLADDLYVQSIDLKVDRSTAAKIEEFPKLVGIALTIFKCTGTADLYLNKKDDEHKITLEPIDYPQTFGLEWFKVRTIYVGNAVQAGRELVIIAWKRTT